MAMLAVVIVPARGKCDEGMLWLAAEQLGAFHLQAEPGAAQAPGTDGGTIEVCLLGRQGGRQQVVDQAQNIGAVARAHEQFGAWRRGAGVIVAAALIQQVATPAGTGVTHGITTSTCRSFPGWPRTWH